MTESAPEIPTDVERRLARERAGQPGVWAIRRHTWEREAGDTTNPPTRTYEWLHVENCPCGCGRELTIRLVRANKVGGDTTWLWDGNEANPTLQPSIRRLHGCRWHGYLTAGRWSACADGAPLAPDCYVSPTAPPVAPPVVRVVPQLAPSSNPAHRYAPPLGHQHAAPARPPHGVVSRSVHAARARAINARRQRR